MLEEFESRAVRAGRYDQPGMAAPLYQQYLTQKPDIKVFGTEVIISMLRDATYSLLAYSIKKNNLFKVDIKALIDYTDKYARMYYKSEIPLQKSGILTLLRSIYTDFIFEHQPNNANDQARQCLADSTFTLVRKMIEVAELNNQKLLR